MKSIKENDNGKNQLMKAVDDIGFGSLRDLEPVKMEHAYIKILLDNFDVGACSIFGSQIKEKDVVRILGVPGGKKIVPESTKAEGEVESESNFDEKSLSHLKKSLKESKTPDLAFKKMFFLYAFANFYCPSTKDKPSSKLYKALGALDSARRYNWGKFILDFLLKGIKNYQKNITESNAGGRNMGIAGCTYLLKVFVLQNVKPLDVKSGMSVMSVWGKRKMKDVVKEQLKELKNHVGPHDTGDDTHARHDDRHVEASSRPSDLNLLHRLDALEKAVFHKKDKRKRGKTPLLSPEERIRKLEEAVFFSHSPFEVVHVDDSFHKRVDGNKLILASLEPDCNLHEDVICYYIRYLKRTMYSKVHARSLLLDTYTYTHLAAKSENELQKWSRSWNVKLDRYSYVFFPICFDHHFSLVIMCITENEESTSILLLHMDSFTYHHSDIVFDTIERGLKYMWAGEPLDFLSISRHIIEVPQQPNKHDCGLFVIHMMKLFLEQAPERYELEDVDKLFGMIWFDPIDACESRQAVKKIIEEEMKIIEEEKKISEKEKNRGYDEDSTETRRKIETSTSFDFSPQRITNLHVEQQHSHVSNDVSMSLVQEENRDEERAPTERSPLNEDEKQDGGTLAKENKVYERRRRKKNLKCSESHVKGEDQNVLITSPKRPDAEPSVKPMTLDLRSTIRNFDGIVRKRRQTKFDEYQLGKNRMKSYFPYK